MDVTKSGTIASLWTKLHNLKGQRITRSEEYAAWTIPHVFPLEQNADAEQTNSLNGLGAEAVNFLANKIVTTLFNPRAPYFRLSPNQQLLENLMEDDQEQMSKAELEQALSQAELRAVRIQESTKALRAQATLAAKLLIITGNALLYYNKQGKPIKVYNLRNYCLQRDADGKVFCIITKEDIRWDAIPDAVKELMPEEARKGKTKDDKVKLYTKVKRDVNTERWSVQQAIDEFDMEATGSYTDETNPWNAITWHLNQGEDYGRGLVEDYAGDFHALDVMSEALIKGLAILSDIKFLVKPGAATQPEDFNRSETGSYHVGREGDITSPQFNRGADFQILAAAIEQYERRIGRAFLMANAVTRDAERVTAEEIRMNANELETAHGGLYSRMVDEWQRPFAVLGLQDINFELLNTFEVNIVAGLETMSRNKDMDNFAWFIQDLKMLNEVPEEIRGAFDRFDLIAFVGSNRGVDYTKFIISKEQAEADAAMAEQKMLENEARLKGMDVAGEVATNNTGEK